MIEDVIVELDPQPSIGGSPPPEVLDDDVTSDPVPADEMRERVPSPLDAELPEAAAGSDPDIRTED
jgi:hypothetical protein